MKEKEVKFGKPVTLIGGGALTSEMISDAIAIAPELVAADGAADKLAAMGHSPAAVIGDMDSIANPSDWCTGRTRFLRIEEQDSTDFEKCLYATSAPFYVGAGFTGRRVDHMLAVFHAMLAYPEKRVVLLGEDEVIALMPVQTTLSLALAPGARVSFFPLLPAKGVQSSGLKWPIDRLEMALGRQIGTSNTAVEAQVSASFDSKGVLILLERRFLGALLTGLGWVGTL